MAYGSSNAIDIDKKLRDDFRRRIRDFGISAETVDPLLAVLFRTFAQQLETLYAETGRMRLALLDELIAGLGIERRTARPAQTVLRFISSAGTQLIETGTELVGEADTGERLTFRTDASVTVSNARMALAATYQNGALRLLGGVDMPDEFHGARPSLEPVSVNLGPNPCIFLAVQDLPPTHLDFHSIFFELGPDAFRVQQALESEPWCIAGAAGELASPGILRPLSLSAGVRSLSWLIEDEAAPARVSLPDGFIAANETKILPPGFYGSKTFVFPRIPEDRQFVCQLPRGMEQAIAKIFGREARALFSQPRAWLRIGMPENVPSLHTNIGRISLHCVTASNVLCLNQTIYFDRHGTSIPISREAGAPAYLVAPLSIVGESGADYLPEYTPSSNACVGRYSVQNGRMELRPARRSDGSFEFFANVRAWTTNGRLGNRVGPGQVRSFLNKGSYSGISVVNPTAAAGGTDEEGYQQAQARFAEALLSRDRLITRQDLTTAVKAFDSRIANARITPQLLRSETGLRRTEQVAIGLNRSDFVDPEVEGRVLKDDLSHFLRARCLDGTHVAIDVEWS